MDHVFPRGLFVDHVWTAFGPRLSCRDSLCKKIWTAFFEGSVFGSGQFVVKSGAFDARVGALRDLEVDLFPFFLDSLTSIKRRFDALMSIKRRLDVLLMLSDNVFK